MASSPPKEVIIRGLTQDGRIFRPSDWAERVAGVMSSFRPGGGGPGSHLSYSPLCVPTVIHGVSSVIVNSELRDLEPMAWDFVINFGKDNGLEMGEGCLLPEDEVPGSFAAEAHPAQKVLQERGRKNW